MSDEFLHDCVVSFADGAVQRRTILSAPAVDILTLGEQVLDRREVPCTPHEQAHRETRERRGKLELRSRRTAGRRGRPREHAGGRRSIIGIRCRCYYFSLRETVHFAAAWLVLGPANRRLLLVFFFEVECSLLLATDVHARRTLVRRLV